MEIVGDGIIDGNTYRSINNAISAAGATQGTATALTADYNNVTTVAASTGVILPALAFNAIAGTTAFQLPHIYVTNAGANALTVYPPTGGTIDGFATNAGITVPVGQTWSGILTASLTWKTVTGIVNGSATTTPLTLVSGTLNTTPVAGGVEFNGQNLYFSSVASQRAEIETVYLYRSNTATTLASQTAAQSWLGNAGTPLTTGVTLQASTVYDIEGEFVLSTTGTTSHTEAVGFTLNGGLTLNNLTCGIFRVTAATGATVSANVDTSTSTGTTVISAAITTSQTNVIYRIRGSVSVNASGQLLPMFAFSAAPGGTSTVAIGAWFRVRPIGAAGQISVGTWS